LRIVFDKNVPVGVRRFLSKHEVRTFVEIEWHPQLENGELLKAAETAGFDVKVTSDQNIRRQQNLMRRQLALVRDHGAAIAAKVDAAIPESYEFIEMPLPPKRRRPAVECGGHT
jgi:hypothetical protein